MFWAVQLALSAGWFALSLSKISISISWLVVANGVKYVTFCSGMEEFSQTVPTMPTSTMPSFTAVRVSENLYSVPP